ELADQRAGGADHLHQHRPEVAAVGQAVAEEHGVAVGTVALCEGGSGGKRQGGGQGVTQGTGQQRHLQDRLGCAAASILRRMVRHGSTNTPARSRCTAAWRMRARRQAATMAAWTSSSTGSRCPCPTTPPWPPCSNRNTWPSAASPSRSTAKSSRAASTPSACSPPATRSKSCTRWEVGEQA